MGEGLAAVSRTASLLRCDNRHRSRHGPGSGAGRVDGVNNFTVWSTVESGTLYDASRATMGVLRVMRGPLWTDIAMGVTQAISGVPGVVLSKALAQMDAMGRAPRVLTELYISARRQNFQKIFTYVFSHASELEDKLTKCRLILKTAAPQPFG